jgi:hypothetical protein
MYRLRYLHLIALVMISSTYSVVSATPGGMPAAAQSGSTKRDMVYGRAIPSRAASIQARMLQQLLIRRQGNDSNCDYLAAQNGVQAIGGDGPAAYTGTRALVPQRPRDYKESFYTLRGPSGSDLPFSINNLGAAPEAFVGVYEALGYNAVMLAAAPGTVDPGFVQAIRDRLAESPGRSFAHLWITPRGYSTPRRLLVPETGEVVDLIYPYHEVAALFDPTQPDRLVILDGLVGYPFTLSLATIASQLRAFNRVIVVSQGAGTLADHQQFQLAQPGRPYVAPVLGGAYLYTARTTWGSAYQRWGEVIGLPLRVGEGPDMRVVLPGEYVHYERVGANEATVVPLGVHMGYELEYAGLLAPHTIMAGNEQPLTNGIRDWAVQQFGSVEGLIRAFGKPLTGEFWLSSEQMRQHVLRGVAFAPVDEAQPGGYIAVLTERAMLIWDPAHGISVAPLGRIYYQELQRQSAQTLSTPLHTP